MGPRAPGLVRRGVRPLVVWALCLVLLLDPLLLRASAEDPPPPPQVPSAQDLLELGRRAHEDLEYETGVVFLQKGLEAGTLSREEKVQALLLLALCLISLDRKQEAQRAFEGLLDLDPSFRPDEAVLSPKVLAVFHQAARARLDALRAADLDPPVLEVAEIVQPVPFRQEIRLTVQATDNRGVAAVQLFLRRGGEDGYTLLPMQEQTQGVFSAVIPAYLVEGSCLEYYVLSMDRAGNTTLKGNTAFPLQVRVEPGEETRPWYRKWWVWAIIGAAAGTGAALGITLSGGGDDSDARAVSLQVRLE